MHWFLNPITEHYVDFEGRASRKQYWMYILYYFILMVILAALAESTPLVETLARLVALGLLLPNLAISVRRLHDIGRTGWWILIGLIPIVGFIVLLVFYVQKGQPGPNTYGPSPTEVNSEPTDDAGVPQSIPDDSQSFTADSVEADAIPRPTEEELK